LTDYCTTTQAAQLLSVSADTVLKWVKAGKIPSYRTPGGHARIPLHAITALLPAAGQNSALAHSNAAVPVFQYCWDYYAGDEGIKADCLACVVYKSQARRCYEMRTIPEEFGHLKIFCESTCEQCEFYQLTHSRAHSALIVSRNRRWLGSLQRQAGASDLRLSTAASEYECAAVVGRVRPDFIVLDCSLGQSRTRELCRHLVQDDRLPFTRVIMTSSKPDLVEDCRQEVFGWIRKPFQLQQLTEFIAGAACEDVQ
jgi:excisionase family DNA binding protein